MLLSKAKTRNVSAPVSETVSADAPPPCAGRAERAGCRGARRQERGARRARERTRGLVRRGGARPSSCGGPAFGSLGGATTTRVKVDDSSRHERPVPDDPVPAQRTRLPRRRPGCGVPTACEVLSSTGLRAGEIVGTTVRGTTPASSRCTSTSRRRRDRRHREDRQRRQDRRHRRRHRRRRQQPAAHGLRRCSGGGR